MYWPDDSVFITGVAKVTKDDAINAMYGTFSLSLVVDVHSNRILSASGNMVMQNTNDFLAHLAHREEASSPRWMDVRRPEKALSGPGPKRR